MQSNFFALKSLAACAMLAAVGAANAGITVYTSRAAFDVAVGASGTDTFADFWLLPNTDPVPSPLLRSAGSFAYTATASGGDNNAFFSAGSQADPWLVTQETIESISFSGFAVGVVAAGGNFFGSGFEGLHALGNFTLSATDAAGTTTVPLTGATTASFLGFVSDGPMLSLTISSQTIDVFPTVDNLVLATAVPEPHTVAMMFAGLGVLGFIARRRRHG
jgi:hypothetical protein